MRRYVFSALVAVSLYSLAAVWPLAGTARVSAAGRAQRVVAIGDVHGATDAFAAILERAGLIDANRRWTGGSTILVQTGDMTDRGAGMRASLDLLMALEQQAARAGGRVHALLGNHEVMNMVGQMRDANAEIFATFGGEPAMREAFGPKGHYGRWLRRKQMIVSVEGSIFMHAGINPEFTQASIDDLNRRAAREIEQWDAGVRLLVERKLVSPSPAFADAINAAAAEIDRLNATVAQGNVPEDAPRVAALLLPVANILTSSLFHQEGPFWFRGYATWTDEEGGARMADLLKRYQAKRFVTGHTPHPGQIRERFGQTLFLIDTGMLGGRFFPNGRPSALELTGDTTRTLYVE